MYICICKSVSDRQIRRSVTEGVYSLRDLCRQTGLGACCGKCVPAARELLAETIGEQPIPRSHGVLSASQAA